MNDFIEYVRNKRLVLVGPSPSIIGSGLGRLIDQHDIVIRMNKAVPVPQHLTADIGTRTDILYNCLEPHPNSGGKVDPVFWKKHNVKWVCSPYPILKFSAANIKRFIHLNNLMKEKLNFHCLDMRLYTDLAKSTQTRPNTGLLAIEELLGFPIKELSIYGMTFGVDGYYKEYNNMTLEQYKKMSNGPNHKQFPQFKYFCETWVGDERLITDQPLNQLIKEYFECKK